MSETPMSPERLAEIRSLLRYESSIAFYSARAKESMLLLLAEAEEAARLRTALGEATDSVATAEAETGEWSARAAAAEAEVERLRAELGHATATLTQLRMESRRGSLESVRSALAEHAAAEQGETGGAR